MEIKEDVSITGARDADLQELFRWGAEGCYCEKWATQEGKKELIRLFEKSLDSFATHAFNLGRKYQMKRNSEG